jgi:TRAP-type uncharacterized transport system substrate-binding protein
MTKLFIVGFLVCSFVFFGFSAEIEMPKMTIRISTGSVGAGWFTTCSSIADWVNLRSRGLSIDCCARGRWNW